MGRWIVRAPQSALSSWGWLSAESNFNTGEDTPPKSDLGFPCKLYRCLHNLKHFISLNLGFPVQRMPYSYRPTGMRMKIEEMETNALHSSDGASPRTWHWERPVARGNCNGHLFLCLSCLHCCSHSRECFSIAECSQLVCWLVLNVNVIQARILLEEGPSIEQTSDWPVRKPVVRCLD